MSGNMTNTGGGSDLYNAGAAHDSGFYDPSIHDNQIVAVFEDQKAATAARNALIDAGVPESQVQVVDHVEGDAAKGVSQAEDKTVGDQILSAFVNLFGSSDDHKDFTHAVDRGHAMVVVTPSGDTDRHRLIQVLEHSHPIDFDAKLAEWRQAGYDNSGAARTTLQEGVPGQGVQQAPRPFGQREKLPERPEGPARVRSYLSTREVGIGMAGGASTKPVGMNADSDSPAPKG